MGWYRRDSARVSCKWAGRPRGLRHLHTDHSHHVVALAAERTPDGHLDGVHPLLVYPQEPGGVLLAGEWGLGHGIQIHSVPGRHRDGSLRLNVGVVDLLAVIIPFQDDIALCKGFFQVAFFNADVGDHIVLGLFVHQPGSRRQRLLRRKNAGDFLVFRLDQLGRRLRLLLGFGKYGGDGFRVAADVLAAQHGHVPGYGAVPEFPGVLVRENIYHPGGRLRRGGV